MNPAVLQASPNAAREDHQSVKTNPVLVLAQPLASGTEASSAGPEAGAVLADYAVRTSVALDSAGSKAASKKIGMHLISTSLRCICKGICCAGCSLIVVFGLCLLVFVLMYVTRELPPDMGWEKGPYSTSVSTVENLGFSSHSQDWLGVQSALAYVPVIGPDDPDDVTFPLLSFSHGDGSGWPWLNFWYGDLLHKVASHGFVILAHESCMPTCGNDQWKDQLRALEWADDLYRSGSSATHPVLKLVDFGKPKGVFGQSTGGRASIQSAASASGVWKTDAQRAFGTCVGAAVLLNSDPCVGETGRPGWKYGDCDAARFVTKVGMAVFTGTADMAEPKGSSLANFDAAPTPDKIYANMTDAGHMDGCSPLWGGFTAAFFQVHLNDQREGSPYYERIYGDQSREDALCSGHYPMAACNAAHPNVWTRPAECATAFASATSASR